MAMRGKVLVVALAMAGISAAAWSAEVSGVVKNQSGEPVVGALVKVKNVDRGVTVTVISRDGGRYQASSLLPGKHTVQGVGAGLQSKRAEITVDGNRPATRDIALTAPLNHRLNASMAEYSTLMPEGAAKTIIVSLCTDCHYGGLQEILYSRKSRDDWAATIEKMRKRPYGIVRSLDISDEQVGVVRPGALSPGRTPPNPPIKLSFHHVHKPHGIYVQAGVPDSVRTYRPALSGRLDA